MKKTILIALMVLCSTAQAQYFQHTYGNDNLEDVLTDALTPQAGTAGYFMTGVTNPVNLPGELVIVRTDLNGNVGCANCYNRRMPIILPGIINTTLEVNAAKCKERSPADPNLAGVIAVVGGWANNTAGTSGIFYTDFAPAGGMNAGPFNISVAGYNLQLGNIAKGTGDVLYITGTASSGSTRNVFVVKFDMATYTVVWGQVYDILPVLPNRANEDGYDVVEDASTPGTIYVVGRIDDDKNPRNYDGFILPINATTGVPANADIYGTAAQEYLSSINPSASTPVGYVIGGLSEDASTKTNDMWALKIDATNAVIWNTKRDYNNVLTKNTEKPMDIIERRNTLRQYEYYQIGQTNGSIYGGMDMIVYKLDNNGANVATGQFTYQGAGSDWGGAIDFANPATNGLAIFGSHEYTGTEIREFWLVRAYYNGVTACNYDRRNLATAQSGPPYLTSLSVSQTGSFSVSNLTSALPSVNDNDDEICYVLNVAIGSNARTAPTENNTGVLISPNPMGHNSAAATVTLEAATDEQATVTIYDVLGKQYYINNFMLKNGKNSLSLDLSGAGMAPGIYSVRISGEATNKTIVLLIK